MFWVIVLLLFLGIMLILLEVVVPHGISIIAGVLVIGYSGYLCYQLYGPGRGGLYVLVSSLLATGAAVHVFRSGLRWMALPPRSQSAAATHGVYPALGEWLKVIQPLRPTGTVEWQGRRFPARSLRPEIESRIGEEVQLKDQDSIYLLVEPRGNK